MKDTAPSGVVTFGELMLRLTTRDHDRFVQADGFDARYTGAEANVAVSLAGFGVPAIVVSRVPEHEIGQACINYLRQFGVDTTHIVRGGDRLGLLYVEQGAYQRSTNVIYDRQGTSFQQARDEDFRWEPILAGHHWFHWSGTAPSRGPQVVRIIQQACSAAKRLGLTVSCDVNYRSRLWSPEEAGPLMTALLQKVDVAFVGVRDASALFGVCGPDDDPVLAARIVRSCFNLRAVVMPLRDGGDASGGRYSALYCDATGEYRSPEYEVGSVDRIGAGDALAAGVIYGMLRGDAPARVIDFAVAAACLKHTVRGDFNLVAVQEVEALMAGSSGAAVRR